VSGSATWRWCVGAWLACAGVAAFAQAEAPPDLLRAVQLHAEKAGVRQVVSWRHALVDLNGDGSRDAVVLLLDPDWCGAAGCTLLVLKGSRRGFTVLSQSGASDAPVRLSPIVVGGWKTLLVYSRGRGEVLMRFTGTRYPVDPSQMPKASAAQIRGASALIVQ
jgi:hypothetical protein